MIQTNPTLYRGTFFNLLRLNILEVIYIKKRTLSSNANWALKPTLVCGANLERCRGLGLISSERRWALCHWEMGKTRHADWQGRGWKGHRWLRSRHVNSVGICILHSVPCLPNGSIVTLLHRQLSGWKGRFNSKDKSFASILPTSSY